MFFKKAGPDSKEMSKPLLPEKQRNAAKIRQGSPIKGKDAEAPSDLHAAAMEFSQREDLIDMQSQS
jgi:hypothetical protein